MDKELAEAEPLHGDIRGLNPDQDILENLALKEARCPYKDVSRNLDLKIPIE